ncbi:Root cap/late embryogenesis-like protein [Melia azedarach]|uniref:Root cap/late embryogenesis-like protein n=1 Tax=Melia azedarach TaxID=155640 RepID=A0ACC1XZA1_MELAZ|nr:Root cap/late embryogenesis-like protein [Melia azedarach]
MAHFKLQFLAPVLLMAMLVAAGATPPGIAKNPSNARCLIKKYKHCYNLVHVCPKFCPDQCTVECVSCKPICSGGSTPPPNDEDGQGGDNKGNSHDHGNGGGKGDDHDPGNGGGKGDEHDRGNGGGKGDDHDHSKGGGKGDDHDAPPVSPTPSTPTPTTPSPSPSKPSPAPPTTPSWPSTPTVPPSTPSSPTPSTPSPSTPSSPTPPSSETGPATARCRNSNYPQCYNMEHACPGACPGGCEVDCVTCKPVCRCDRPGAVCQDPRFIGGDGITFYFHGKKEKDFCLFSDSNIHINAHFIGRRNENMKRDFTWVQSLAILFDKHQLFIGALKTSTWDDSVDRLALSFDGEPVSLSEKEGSKWQYSTNVSIIRAAETNSVTVEVEGQLKITAKVVPITEEDSRIHNYGITKEDCFAHLDLGFKFYSLSDEVNGVLGQTYRPGYVTKVNMGANMPVMGGDRDFETSSLFATDCAAARFNGAAFDGEESMKVLELPNLSCASGIDGKGVVCKR